MINLEKAQTYSEKKSTLFIPTFAGFFLLILGIKGYLDDHNLILLFLALIFGLTAFSGILNLFPFISSLTTTQKGIMVRSFFRKTFVTWDEIDSIENKKVLLQNKIVIHFKPTYGKKFLGMSIGKRRNNFSAVLPLQYNVKAEELQKYLK